MTNLTKYEMETVVNYNAAEQTAMVYTSLQIKSQAEIDEL